MGIRNQARKIKAQTKLNMLSGFRDFKTEKIGEIPLERTLFPGTKNDYWQKLIIPNHNCTACIYELDTGCNFFPHNHPNRFEQFSIITANGELEIITVDDYYNLKYPNSVGFEKGEIHAVRNLSPFMVKLLVIWTPEMDGDFEIN